MNASPRSHAALRPARAAGLRHVLVLIARSAAGAPLADRGATSWRARVRAHRARLPGSASRRRRCRAVEPMPEMDESTKPARRRRSAREACREADRRAGPAPPSGPGGVIAARRAARRPIATRSADVGELTDTRRHEPLNARRRAGQERGQRRRTIADASGRSRQTRRNSQAMTPNSTKWTRSTARIAGSALPVAVE